MTEPEETKNRRESVHVHSPVLGSLFIYSGGGQRYAVMTPHSANWIEATHKKKNLEVSIDGLVFLASDVA